MSLSKYPCKYAVMTSMRCKSNPSKTAKQIRYINMIASHHRRICFPVVNTRSLQETLSYESRFISRNFIALSYKYSFISNKFDNFRHLNYKSKYFSFF